MLGTNIFAVALVLARGPVWRTRVYRPMLLNLALSAAPLAVLLLGSLATAALLVVGPGRGAAVAMAAAVGLVWLLLLPNSGYLITELNLSHRREGESVPLWYDIVLVLTLAMSGVLTTVLNVFLVQFEYAIVRYGDEAASLRQPDVRALAVGLLVLVPVGMYLGRYIRLNSWDVRRPTRISRKIRDHLAIRGRVRELLAFTVLHAIFLGLMYLVTIAPVIDGLAAQEQSPSASSR